MVSNEASGIRHQASGRAEAIRKVVATVVDPEIPVLTIDDLGVLREVVVDEDGTVVVTITPTYSGCPATEQIREDVEQAIVEMGLEPAVSFAMSPAWTTDWITADGREKLRAAGIAPPHPTSAAGDHVALLDLPVACPRCGSRQTRRVSDFGSTACKASYTCGACAEPFEHVKAL